MMDDLPMPAAAEARSSGRDTSTKVVERGPPSSGRYLRYDVILGKGAFKTVYKGFDEREGIEVAWNQVRSIDFMSEGQKLTQEISVLKNMKHKNVMFFYDSWIDEANGTVNFITELFTSGTLRQYRQKHKNLNKNALKRWAWQILQGLVYLHGHDPPIIHRDLKCDNIFVNGSAGVVKIGDLGLATLLRRGRSAAPQSCLGTPEFMAPELYNERYDEKVDVYSFGMCMLELATMQYPYHECDNAAQIYKRVTQGQYPQSLKNVEDDELRDFIQMCILHERSLRPDSRKLLKHSFFEGCRGKNGERDKAADAPSDGPPHDAPAAPARRARSPGSSEHTSQQLQGSPTGSVVAPSRAASESGAGTPPDSPPPASPVALRVVTSAHGPPTAPPPGASTPSTMTPSRLGSSAALGEVFVRAEAQDQEAVSAAPLLSMEVCNLPQRGGERCNIEFSFAIGVDNVKDVISEMQEELNLDLADQDAAVIKNLIDDELHRAQGTFSQASAPSTPQAVPVLSCAPAPSAFETTTGSTDAGRALCECAERSPEAPAASSREVHSPVPTHGIASEGTSPPQLNGERPDISLAAQNGAHAPSPGAPRGSVPRNGAVTTLLPKSPLKVDGSPRNGVHAPQAGPRRSDSGTEPDVAARNAASEAIDVVDQPSGALTFQQLRRRLEEADAQGLLQEDDKPRTVAGPPR